MVRPFAGRQIVRTVGVAMQLSAAPFPVNGAVITAFSANTDDIHLGPDGVSAASGVTNGYILRPGQSQPLPETDLSWWWIDGKVANEGVSIGAMVT